MERYIHKMAVKFGLKDCRITKTPIFAEADIYSEAGPEIKFPVREAVGSLSWLVCVCRPDICHPVNVLARVVNKPVRKGIVNSIKKVMRYVISTPKIGVFYSPDNERSFRNTLRKILQEHAPDGDVKRLIRDWNLFNDASFASCHVTMLSTSGAIDYFLGSKT